MMSRYRKARNANRSAGFSIIEVLIAAVLLVVGLLSLMALFAKALSAVNNSQQDQIARQKAREALESIYAARNDKSIPFDDFQNQANGGIFKDGFVSLYLPGNDGVPGTDKDTTVIDRVILPGKNGIVETSPGAATPGGDDVLVPLTNMRRQILFSDVVGSDGSVNLYMRRVTVTVRVNNGATNFRDYSTSAYISSYQ